MAIIGIAPGGSGTFVAAPLDKNGNPSVQPAGVLPTWTCSLSGAVVTPSASDPSGLTASVSVPTSAVPGTPFTLSLSSTLADGTTPSGTASVPVLSLEVASYTINQTA